MTAMTDSLKAFGLIKNDPAKYDLVITDQTMPNMTGAELAQKLLPLNPELPIILLTGYSSKVDKTKALEIGVKGFGSKPLNRSEILTLVRDVLDMSS